MLKIKARWWWKSLIVKNDCKSSEYKGKPRAWSSPQRASLQCKPRSVLSAERHTASPLRGSQPESERPAWCRGAWDGGSRRARRCCHRAVSLGRIDSEQREGFDCSGPADTGTLASLWLGLGGLIKKTHLISSWRWKRNLYPHQHLLQLKSCFHCLFKAATEPNLLNQQPTVLISSVSQSVACTEWDLVLEKGWADHGALIILLDF